MSIQANRPVSVEISSGIILLMGFGLLFPAFFALSSTDILPYIAGYGNPTWHLAVIVIAVVISHFVTSLAMLSGRRWGRILFTVLFICALPFILGASIFGLVIISIYSPLLIASYSKSANAFFSPGISRIED